MTKYKVLVQWDSIEVEVTARNKREAAEKAVNHPNCEYPTPNFSYIPNCDIEVLK